MFRIFQLSFAQIERKGKYSVIGFSVLRMLIGFFDLVAIGLVGLILTLALNSDASVAKNGLLVQKVLNVFRIVDVSLIQQLIVLGCFTTILFLLKIIQEMILILTLKGKLPTALKALFSTQQLTKQFHYFQLNRL